MGAHTSRIDYNQWNFDELAEASGLSREEIDRLHLNYIQAAGHDGIMSMDEFIRFYSQLPGIEGKSKRMIKERAAQIFRTFDQDHTNTLSFDEFLAAIIMLNQNSPQHNRIDYLIRQNNMEQYYHDNELISSQYGLQILRHLCDFHSLPTGTEQQYWKEIDQDNRGHVTQEEFIDFICRHPNLS